MCASVAGQTEFPAGPLGLASSVPWRGRGRRLLCIDRTRRRVHRTTVRQRLPGFVISDAHRQAGRRRLRLVLHQSSGRHIHALIAIVRRRRWRGITTASTGKRSERYTAVNTNALGQIDGFRHRGLVDKFLQRIVHGVGILAPVLIKFGGLVLDRVLVMHDLRIALRPRAQPARSLRWRAK
jgi:hypothetical protein